MSLGQYKLTLSEFQKFDEDTMKASTSQMKEARRTLMDKLEIIENKMRRV